MPAARQALLGDRVRDPLVHRQPDRLVDVALRRRRARRGSVISVFGGSSVATSSLVRRSRNGLTRRSAGACARASPCFSIGVRKRLRKLLASPRRPGERKSNSDHSSPRLFSQRRAGQAEAVARASSCEQPAAWLGVGFLIVCASSRTSDVPVLRRQHRVVARQQRIGRQHEVVRRDRRRTALAVLARAAAARAARREALRLAPPVRHQAGRRDDQRRRSSRPAPSRWRGGQGLHRLAEAHVVREHAAEAGARAGIAARRRPAPGRAAACPEIRRQRGRRDRPRRRAELAPSARSASPPCQAMPDPASIPARSAASIRVKPMRPAPGSSPPPSNSSIRDCRIGRICSRGRESSRPSGSGSRTGPLGEFSGATPAAHQVEQHGNEVHLLPVDRYAEMQVQPVDAGAFLQPCLQRALGLNQADGEIGGDLHLPAIRPQRRDLLLQHEEPVGVVLRLVVQQEGVGAAERRQRHPRGHEADAQQARHRRALRRRVAPHR